MAQKIQITGKKQKEFIPSSEKNEALDKFICTVEDFNQKQ